MTDPTERALQRLLAKISTKPSNGVTITTKKPTKGPKTPAKGSGKGTTVVDDIAEESDQSVEVNRPETSKRKKPHDEDGEEDGGTPSKRAKQ